MEQTASSLPPVDGAASGVPPLPGPPADLSLCGELPVLEPRRCTGCALCVAICPTQCLAVAGGLPWLPRPLDCVACAACALMCPTQALTLRPLSAEHP